MAACAQKPPTVEEASRAYNRTVNDLTFATPFITGDLAKETRFDPKALSRLLNCKPAKGQPGNICTFTIKGSLAMPGIRPPISPVELTATGRFYKEKNGEWKLFYVKPKNISVPHRKCTGVSRCVVSYPPPTDKEALGIFTSLASKAGKAGFQYEATPGERDFFRPEKLVRLKCSAPALLGYTCEALISGLLTKPGDSDFYGGRQPKAKVLKLTILQIFTWKS